MISEETPLERLRNVYRSLSDACRRRDLRSIEDVLAFDLVIAGKAVSSLQEIKNELQQEVAKLRDELAEKEKSVQRMRGFLITMAELTDEENISPSETQYKSERPPFFVVEQCPLCRLDRPVQVKQTEFHWSFGAICLVCERSFTSRFSKHFDVEVTRRHPHVSYILTEEMKNELEKLRSPKKRAMPEPAVKTVGSRWCSGCGAEREYYIRQLYSPKDDSDELVCATCGTILGYF